MTRPRVKVNEKNVSDIYNYFEVFHSQKRYYKHMKGDHVYNQYLKELDYNQKIREAFLYMKQIENDKPSFILLLQQWIDAYVPEKLWKLCTNALRQNRFVNTKAKVCTIKISRKNRTLLDRCIDLSGLAFNDVLYEALYREEQRLIDLREAKE
jgi:hypothetical protein